MAQGIANVSEFDNKAEGAGGSIIGDICKSFNIEQKDIRTYSPLTLAYIGDSIFDVVIKTVLVETANCPANRLHKMATGYVKAESQSKMMDAFLDILSDEEKDILRRGRNAKSFTSAKNASIADYRKATGVETLIGYLYLIGRMDRIIELIRFGMEAIDR